MSLIDEINAAIADGAEQRTQTWYELRLGKFTASEIHKLMGGGKRKMTEAELAARPKGEKRVTIDDDTALTDGAITYIETKIAEIWTGRQSDSFESFATEWGNQNEDLARKEFEQRYKVTVTLNGHNVWSEQPNEAGGSSDGFVEGQDAIIEIKCPFNSGIHVSYCRAKSQDDLPVAYKYQMQANMLFSGKSKCYFISYDPRVMNEKNRLFVLEVPADKELQEQIKAKLNVAIKEKQRLLNDLNA